MSLSQLSTFWSRCIFPVHWPTYLFDKTHLQRQGTYMAPLSAYLELSNTFGGEAHGPETILCLWKTLFQEILIISLMKSLMSMLSLEMKGQQRALRIQLQSNELRRDVFTGAQTRHSTHKSLVYAATQTNLKQTLPTVPEYMTTYKQ